MINPAADKDRTLTLQASPNSFRKLSFFDQIKPRATLMIESSHPQKSSEKQMITPSFAAERNSIFFSNPKLTKKKEMT